MSARDEIRDNAVHALLNANTRAGTNVFTPRTWPGWTGVYPMLVVRTPRVRRASEGPHGPPTFDSRVDLTVHGRLEAATEADGDELGRILCEQIEDGILRNGWFIFKSGIEEFSVVDTDFASTAEGRKFITEIRCLFVCRVFETFQPTIDAEGDPFPPRHEISGIDIKVDARNMEDPTGTYPAPTEPPYTPTTAPRTEGPDGRIEGAAIIDLEQS